ncbi:unnamed protein product [Symbiodinium sp. CCMP2592]|nr:unnamed protein product [Symbiodinium sp. CCMP2592]
MERTIDEAKYPDFFQLNELNVGAWKAGGRVYLHRIDVEDSLAPLGSAQHSVVITWAIFLAMRLRRGCQVFCHLYKDAAGIGAESVMCATDDSSSTGTPSSFASIASVDSTTDEAERHQPSGDQVSCCGFGSMPHELSLFKFLGAKNFCNLRAACATLASNQVLLKNLLDDACRSVSSGRTTSCAGRRRSLEPTTGSGS